jgi:hypothetical protein
MLVKGNQYNLTFFAALPCFDALALPVAIEYYRSSISSAPTECACP